MLLLKCMPPSEAEYMWESCLGAIPSIENFKTRLLLAHMKIDCMVFAQRCDKCQRFLLISKAHPEELTTKTSP